MLILSTERTGLFPSAPADAPVEANDGAENGKKDYDGYGQIRHDRLPLGAYAYNIDKRLSIFESNSKQKDE